MTDQERTVYSYAQYWHLPNVGKNADMMLYLLRGIKTCLTSSKLCVLVFLVRTNFCNRFNVPMDSALSSASVPWQKNKMLIVLKPQQTNKQTKTTTKSTGNLVLILRTRKSHLQRINYLHNGLKLRHFLTCDQ